MKKTIGQWINSSGKALDWVWYVRHFARILVSDQSRYTGWWLKSFQKEYMLNAPLPWLSFPAIEYVQSQMTSGMNIFEYGSGASTLFWLHHQANVISIEHDAGWYQRLSEYYIPRLQQPRAIDYRHIGPEPLPATGKGYADPDAYVSSLPEYSGDSFQTYCQQIDGFPNDFFDIVLVDGRVRNSCIKHAYQKVKVGGLLVLDNSDRPHYLAQTAHLLTGFEAKVFGGVTPTSPLYSQTTVFIRHT